MATDLTDCNEFSRRFDWKTELGLGSNVYSGSGDVRVSNTVGIGANLLHDLIAKGTGTTFTIDAYISDSTGPASLGSPDFTLAVGTSVNAHLEFATTDTKRYVTLRVTPAGAGSLAKNALRACDLMPVKSGIRQGYPEATEGFNGVPQTAAYAPTAYTGVA